MNKRVMGAILLVAIGLVVIVGIWFLMPKFKERKQVATSDARKTKGKITLALDNWIGYFPLQSPEMKSVMRRSGWILVCEDDKADYKARMERLSKKEIDFAVVTVDSFILNAAKYNYPATIIAVLDESKGGDAIVARKTKASSINDLKKATDLKIAFTPDSPSHYLAKATSHHFSVPSLLPSGRLFVPTQGSSEAAQKLVSGKADVAILWEPDVSRILAQEGIVKILGTENTEKLIVDILVVNRDFSKSNPEVVKTLLRDYFRVLKKYRDNPDLLRSHVVEATGLAPDVVGSMLKGVRWVNLTENCEKWFGMASPGGLGSEGLVDTIESTVRVLVNSGDFSDSPIPDNDPYRLMKSSYLESLYVSGSVGFKRGGAMGASQTDSLAVPFEPLDESGWSALKEVGTLKIDPIMFQSGSTTLDLLAKATVDKAVASLKHYPGFRVIVKGHTDTRGDENENRRLSQERAESVAKYMKVAHGIDANRLNAKGYGGKEPVPQQPGESYREWLYRLPRVELTLVREEL